MGPTNPNEMTRRIVSHHDGHGLNDLMEIRADDRHPVNGNASHRYHVVMDITGTAAAIAAGCTGKTDDMVADVQFQFGPRKEPGSVPGCTEAVLMAILIDRLEGFQSGPYACVENDEQLIHLRAALAATRKRADARAARGVLGKNEK